MIDRFRENWRIAVIVGAGLAVLFLANGHLVFVAVNSQPDCVAHSKTTDGTKITFRAAKSSC